jgi:hypothetical protein
MGTGRFLTCKNCNWEWNHYEGVGFQNEEILYCNVCGTSKENPDGEMCFCGGSFVGVDENFEIVICPNCQSRNINLENEELLWD